MLDQKEWENISSIIYEVNRIKDLAKMRKGFLNLLGRMVVFDFADFYLNDTKSAGRVKLVDPVVVSSFPQKFNEKFMIEYDKCYGQVDYVKWIFSSHESIVYKESDLINNEMRRKSAFFLDYLKPAGLVNVAGISLAENGACIGAVTLYRTERNGDFSDKDIYILNQLMPHLQNKLVLEYEAIESNIKKNNFGSYLLMHEYNLSKREIEIIKLLCEGKNNIQISVLLSISVNTVKKHISNIFDKLQVDSRTQLINFLHKNDKEIFDE